MARNTVKVKIAGGNTNVGCRNAAVIIWGCYALICDWGLDVAQMILRQGEEGGGNGAQPKVIPLEELCPPAELLDGLKVMALLITHGHMDHSEGWPEIVKRFGEAPIITDYFTKRVIEMRAQKQGRMDFPRFITSAYAEIGPFKIQRFEVNHSILGASGFLVEVDGRRIIHLGDYKSWPLSGGRNKNHEVFASLREAGPIHLIFSDATNAKEAGYVISETSVQNRLRLLLNNEGGRVVLATIASNTIRTLPVAEYAKRQGREVFVGGASMRDFLCLVEEEQFWMYVTQRNFWNAPSPGSFSIVSGSQGEHGSFLDRVARGIISWRPMRSDVLAIAQDTIPILEIEESFVAMGESLSEIFERIYLTEDTPVFTSRGAEIIRDSTFHSTGHPKQGDVKRVLGELGAFPGGLQKIAVPNPEVLPLIVPVHADREKRLVAAGLIEASGGRAVLAGDGDIVEL